MPPYKKSTKNKTYKKAAKPAKSFEETLWDTANKLRGSVESSDWSGATETTHQSCSDGERGGANQNASPLLHSSFSLLTSTAKGEGEIRQKMVEYDLVDCVENQAYPLAA